MNLGQIVTYCILKGASLYGSIPIQMACANAFGRKAGFDMDSSHIFHQGVLAAISLVVGGAGDKAARAGTRYEAGLLCTVAVTSLSGAGSDSKLLEQKP